MNLSTLLTRRTVAGIAFLLIVAGLVVGQALKDDTPQVWPVDGDNPEMPNDMYLDLLKDLGEAWELRPNVLPAMDVNDTSKTMAKARRS